MRGFPLGHCKFGCQVFYRSADPRVWLFPFVLAVTVPVINKLVVLYNDFFVEGILCICLRIGLVNTKELFRKFMEVQGIPCSIFNSTSNL